MEQLNKKTLTSLSQRNSNKYQSSKIEIFSMSKIGGNSLSNNESWFTVYLKFTRAAA